LDTFAIEALGAHAGRGRGVQGTIRGSKARHQGGGT
jgi:hypothetical protein